MKKTLLIFATLMFLMVSMVSVDALTLRIPDTTGYIGKTITIPVDLENASDIGSIELVVLYNNSILSAKKVEKGGLTKGLITSNTSEAGIIAVNLVDSNGISGDGDIIKITFDVLSEGSTPLMIQNARAYNVDTYTDLPVDTVDGVLTASASTAGSGQTPGFELQTTMIVLLVAIFILRQRRK